MAAALRRAAAVTGRLPTAVRCCSGSAWADSAPAPPVAGSHSVLNQSAGFPDVNVYSTDAAVVDGVRLYGGSAFEEQLSSFGAYVGCEATRRRHRDANDAPPSLRNWDRTGARVDVVDFHPAYHALFASGVAARVPSLAWTARGAPGAHVARGTLALLQYQADPGVSCPLSMTFAAVPALGAEPVVAEEWVPRLLSAEYDPRDAPAQHKRGATVGMSMTEKQGGSDVRANTTTATPLDSNGECWALTGHKWFTSAPMSDAFLTLAQVPGAGVTCFLVPRWLPDGSRNANFHVMRLKNKLGDRSNASSEVEYHGAWARRVGAPGKGVSTIVDMVVCTRLDCALGAAGLQRQALRHALQHAAGRSAFGTTLLEAPAMRALLADLAVESEASVAMALYVASLFDACEAAPGDAGTAALKRLVTAVVKYWTTKRSPGFVYEAMEAHGGNGYVYEWDMPRLYAQAPLNSIWEGSGNTIVLDVLRTLGKEPAALKQLLAVLEAPAAAPGAPPAYLAALQQLKADIATATTWLHADDGAALQYAGRALVDGMATTLAAALLLTRTAALAPLPGVDGTALQAVSDTYLASRLAGEGMLAARGNYGALPPSVGADNIDAILSRQYTAP